MLHTILTRTPKRIRTWATIAAYQGLRCCEISGLDKEHITEQRKAKGRIAETLRDMANRLAMMVARATAEGGRDADEAGRGGLDGQPVVARQPPPELNHHVDFEPPVDRVDQVGAAPDHDG